MGKKEIESETLKKVINAMAQSFDDELFALKEGDLVKTHWFFDMDEREKGESLLWWMMKNIYTFNERLDLLAYSCRKWEEHHNGSCCVVERVRDKYLMPRIKEFCREIISGISNAWTSVDDDLPEENGFYEVVVEPSNYHVDFPEIHSRIRVSKFYPEKDEAVHFYCNVRYLSAARELGEKAQHWAISHEEGYVVTHWRKCPPMPEEPTA